MRNGCDRCACGKAKMITADTCFYCHYRANGWKGGSTKPRAPKPAPTSVRRHVPSSIYVQPRTIEARYQWSLVIQRETFTAKTFPHGSAA